MLSGEDIVPAIRRVNIGEDMDELLALFELVFGHAVTRETWRWKYQPPWEARTFSSVALAGGQMIAHLGAVPSRGWIRGKEVPFFLLADIMVHPAHQGRLAYDRRLWTEAAEGVRAVFPDAVFYGFTEARRALLYRRIGLSTATEAADDRVLRLGARDGECDAAYTVTEQNFDDPRLDSTWEQYRDDVPAGLIRDRLYLQWRYARHPHHCYLLLGAAHCGVPIGWLVTESRPRRPHEGGEVRVLDTLLPKRHLIPVLHCAARELEAEALVSWGADGAGFEHRTTGWVRMVHLSGSLSAPHDLLASAQFTLGEADAWWW